MSYPFSLIVAAAGSGSRMGNGQFPKALHVLGENTLIGLSTSAFLEHANEVVIVIQENQQSIFQSEFTNNLPLDVKFIYQKTPNGTASAASLGVNASSSDWVLLVWGDHIGASFLDFRAFQSRCIEYKADFYLPVIRKQNPYVYFECGADSQILNFRETRKGANNIPEGLTDCGFFFFNRSKVLDFFSNCYPQAMLDVFSGDLNFLSLLPDMQRNGIEISLVTMTDLRLTLAVNTLIELSQAQEVLKSKGEIRHD